MKRYKIAKYILKSFIGHTIHCQVDELKEMPVSERDIDFTLVAQIIAKQKTNPRYDYASHEQIEIDRLVYEAYGLNDEDIGEVETWYARRYPRLAEAQARNRAAVEQATVEQAAVVKLTQTIP